MKKIKAWCKK